MTLDHRPFSRGCWEVTWEHAGDPTGTEVSQVDAHDPDDGGWVVRENDEGYGEVSGSPASGGGRTWS